MIYNQTKVNIAPHVTANADPLMIFALFFVAGCGHFQLNVVDASSR